MVECTDAGAEEYLTKPVTKKEVSDVWQHVRRRERARTTLTEDRGVHEVSLGLGVRKEGPERSERSAMVLYAAWVLGKAGVSGRWDTARCHEVTGQPGWQVC